MNIVILNSKQLESGKWTVTYKFYEKGACACTAKKRTNLFDHEPTLTELRNLL